MAVWDDIIGAQEKAGHDKARYGTDIARDIPSPAVLVVDMTYAYVDSAFPFGFSETGWPAVNAISKLLAKARELKMPILYSRGAKIKNEVEKGLWKTDAMSMPEMKLDKAYEIVSEIAPTKNDLVIDKLMPSAFFGTMLSAFLTYLKVDSLIVCGMVTSGCVRATVVDAFSHNYKVIVPEECVADRSPISHKVSLYDIHMKYGDVLPLENVLKILDSIALKKV